MVWQNILQGFFGASWLDLTNLLLGVFGVVLMVRRSLWAFPVGLVAVSVQAVLFWQAKFYADAKLQGFFFGCLVYGWWHWSRPQADKTELPVTVLSWRARMGWLATATGLTLAWGAWQQAHTDAVMPYRDAFIAAFSLLAQLLQVRKQLENWVVWLAVNAVAVTAYWSADLAFTAFLYLLYLALATYGLWAWMRALRPGKPRGDGGVSS